MNAFHWTIKIALMTKLLLCYRRTSKWGYISVKRLFRWEVKIAQFDENLADRVVAAERIVVEEQHLQCTVFQFTLRASCNVFNTSDV